MGETGTDESSNDRVEVRVLGPLRARRADGSLVDPRAWSTEQTADLLRMLALHVDEPVPVDVLVEALWPTVDEKRGRGSLRTAASRIRKALGTSCIERRMGGLVLRNTWVDANAFRTLARETRRHVVTGSATKVVTTTREAEPLYLADFRWHKGNADWALSEQEALAASHRQMIADAADAAITLSWWHDALDFAQRSVLLEPCSERGYRALMRAYQGLGETSRALQTYERCRRTLVEEIGADPSAETQALYLQLLNEEPVVLPTPAFCGRGHELRWLRDVAEATDTGEGPVVVCLVGGAGSGKSRLLREAWRDAGVRVEEVSASGAGDTVAALVRALGAQAGPSDRSRVVPPPGVPVVAVLDDAHLLAREEVRVLAATFRGLPRQVMVVVAGRPSPDGGAMEQLIDDLGEGFDGRAHLLQLPPLAEEEVAELSAALLQGEVSAELTREVLAEAGGEPGAVIDLVRGWAGSGRVAATTGGLVVLQEHRSSDLGSQTRQLLAQAVDHLPAEELEVLHLIAVLGQPVSPDALLPLTVDDQGAASNEAHLRWLQKTLDHLVDRTLLVAGEAGFATRDPLLRDALVSWLRPSGLRRLEHRIAERARIPAAERIGHWREAGEPQLARAASIEASADAMSEGRYELARPHLRQLSRLSANLGALPSDRLEVLERLGDVCGALGRATEAQAAFSEASDVARAHQMPDLKRVDTKFRLALGATLIPQKSLEPWASVGVVAALDLSLGISRDASPDAEVEQLLSTAVRDADHGNDPEERSALRLLLTSTVCIPRREFRAAHRWTSEALSLTVDPTLCARATLARWLPGAVLGNGSVAEDHLNDAAALAERGSDTETAAHIAALRALVAHDLGRAGYEPLYTAAAEAGALTSGGDHQWVVVRIATERGELTRAEAAARAPLAPSVPPVLRQLHDVASAALAMELGQPELARDQLLEVIELAEETGTTLLVPEAAARLVILEAAVDVQSARERFELFDWAVGGDGWLPRENILRLLARAAMRAAGGRPDAAAAAAAAAADAAESKGLVLLAAQSHRYRAVHLSAAGRHSEARLARAAAARSYQVAGATAFVHRAETDLRRATSARNAAGTTETSSTARHPLGPELPGGKTLTLPAQRRGHVPAGR